MNNDKVEQMKREGYVSTAMSRMEAERLQREREAKREQRERENAQLEEDIKQGTLKKLREAYERQSIWERTKRKIDGKAPNWKALEQYSAESIEYLERVRRGDTYEQKSAVERNRKAARDTDGKVHEYSEETINAKNFNKFLQKLTKSDSELKREMEVDKNARIAAHARGMRGF